MPPAGAFRTDRGEGVSEPKGIALIGTGFWGRRLAAAVGRTPELRLVTCYSRGEDKRASFAAEFGCEAADTLEAAFEHPEVQGAVLATPNTAHAAQAQALAAVGKHVFVEKPIAHNLDDGRAMRAACEAAGVSLMVGHSFRRLGAARKVKELLENGTLGKIVLAEANFSLPGTLTPDKWRYYRQDNPGGPLMQLGIHHVDTLQYWLGPVRKVQGAFARLHTSAEIDDVASVQMLFSNGALGTLNSSYVSPKTYDLRLYGTEGVLEYYTDMSIWPNAEKMDEATRLSLWTKIEQRTIDFERRDMLVEELGEFARCMEGSAQPETDAVGALNTLQVVLEAVRSHGEGVALSLA